jgi:predicted ATP-dependent serine protease
MSVEDLIKRSPMSLLGDRGLGKGNLGVLMARAGVGKTTFLVQLGLQYLLQKKSVLHVSLVQSVEQVQARYDALFEGARRCDRFGPPRRAAQRAVASAHD